MRNTAETKAKTAAKLFWNAVECAEIYETNAEKRAYLRGALNILFVGGFYNYDEYEYQYSLVTEAYPLEQLKEEA